MDKEGFFPFFFVVLPGKQFNISNFGVEIANEVKRFKIETRKRHILKGVTSLKVWLFCILYVLFFLAWFYGCFLCIFLLFLSNIFSKKLIIFSVFRLIRALINSYWGNNFLFASKKKDNSSLLLPSQITERTESLNRSLKKRWIFSSVAWSHMWKVTTWDIL